MKMHTEIHSTELTETPTSFSNHYYMAFPAWEGHKCHHVSIPLLVISCADLHRVTCTSIFSLQDIDQHSQKDLGSPFQLSHRLNM